MKVVMTLLVRDEADVVETTIAYHLAQGVDHVIVTNNRSRDGTREIVERFVREGRVTLIDERGDDHSQARWVTRMARMAAAMGADWVINGDADELWWPLEGDLKSTLASVPVEYGSVIADRSNALPLRDPRGGHPFEKMTRRHRHSLNVQGGPLPGKAAHRAAADVEVASGNHAAFSPALGPPRRFPALLIFHFPYRSYAQCARKIANGGAALARNTELPPAVGDGWRFLYAELGANRLRAWYEALAHADDPACEQWIAAGDVVDDARIATFLRTHGLLADTLTARRG